MTLRRGALDDAVDMGRILSGWIDETAWMPRLHSLDDDRNFCRRLLSATDTHVVALQGRVEGFVSREDQTILALYLAPAARGKGWGKALLDLAKSDCPVLSLWTFQANADALRFYTREGFSAAARTDGASNDELLPDIQMTWRRT